MILKNSLFDEFEEAHAKAQRTRRVMRNHIVMRNQYFDSSSAAWRLPSVQMLREPLPELCSLSTDFDGTGEEELLKSFSVNSEPLLPL